MQLKNKHVLITGAGSGIGRELAILASRRGMIVALTGRRIAALRETHSMMHPRRGHLILPADITERKIPRALAHYLSRSWGRLDVLVNNAGVVPVGPLSTLSDEELANVMSTNVVAPAALIRELLPLLCGAAPSRIVNVGSMFGDIPYPLFAAYSASKHALRGLSIALRRELKEYGVAVTYAAPRATNTDAASAFGRLVDPMQMRVDDPNKVAAEIWSAVARDCDTVYAKGPERFFVLVQRLLPHLVDRSIAGQMADELVRSFLADQLA
jgi:short-subunit dehydrogenase